MFYSCPTFSTPLPGGSLYIDAVTRAHRSNGFHEQKKTKHIGSWSLQMFVSLFVRTKPMPVAGPKPWRSRVPDSGEYLSQGAGLHWTLLSENWSQPWDGKMVHCYCNYRRPNRRSRKLWFKDLPLWKMRGFPRPWLLSGSRPGACWVTLGKLILDPQERHWVGGQCSQAPRGIRTFFRVWSKTSLWLRGANWKAPASGSSRPLYLPKSEHLAKLTQPSSATWYNLPIQHRGCCSMSREAIVE